MLEKIKKSLRISSDLLDDDIQHNIDACLLDLQMAGIRTDVSSELLVKAVELYCKWAFDHNDLGERWYAAYNSLKQAMSLSSIYASSTEEA